MRNSLALIGATGVVGASVIDVLHEMNMRFDEFIAVASEKSYGKKVKYFGEDIPVVGIEQALSLRPRFAIFCAGKDVSLQYAKKFTQQGTIVVDNSSAWRLEKDVPLVVPEINPETIANHKLIANPNCSTIQMVLALSNLHKRYGIKRIVVSTYQSVTGSGKKGIDQLSDERMGKSVSVMAYPHQIDLNVIPQGGMFCDNGYTEEEMKLVNETRKIFNDNNIRISPTVVRVPVFGGHSEAVNVEFHTSFDLNEVFDILNNTYGVTVCDDPSHQMYPMPITAQGNDAVFVGRIRKDLSHENTLNLWIVADNLRKGAATNAVQIVKLFL